MSRNDGEEHARLRRISVARVHRAADRPAARLDPAARRRPGRCDARPRGADGVVDVKTELANQLPVRVIVDLIGVPQADRDADLGVGRGACRAHEPGRGEPAPRRRGDRGVPGLRPRDGRADCAAPATVPSSPAHARGPAGQRGADRGRAGRDVRPHPVRRQRDDDEPARQRVPGAAAPPRPVGPAGRRPVAGPPARSRS